MDIGKKIKEFREKSNISQLMFCKLLNINQSDLSKIENNKNKTFNIEFLDGLIKHYNINLNTIFDSKYSKIEFYSSKNNSNLEYQNIEKLNVIEDNPHIKDKSESEIDHLNMKISKLEDEKVRLNAIVDLFLNQQQNKQAR